MERAGFFDDGLSRQERKNLGLDSTHQHPAHGVWQTPLPVLTATDDRPLVVLLATGAFAPLHAGHAGMMEAARQACQNQGCNVIAGYFSPSHDLYVQSKDGGRAAILTAGVRIHEARTALETDDAWQHSAHWLVDGWESQGVSRPLNFTDVAKRLGLYLRRQLGRDVRVAFVFGSDNADFAEAFTEHGLGVCVSRPGYGSTRADISKAPVGLDGGCLQVEGRWDISSTQVRIERNQAKAAATPLPAMGSYVLRDEGEWATSHWQDRIDARILSLAWDEFARSVKKHLQKAFLEHAILPNRYLLPDALLHWPQPTRWEEVHLEQQLAIVRAWQAEGTLLNLDPCSDRLPGVIAWPWSRRFRVSTLQARPHSYGVRPGGALPQALPSQAILVDDDRATGATLQSALAALSGKTILADMRFLVPASLPGRNIFDVVDCRDFLPGAREGGLVVEVGEETYRVPYMAPFVDLATRARIPPTQTQALSRRLWTAAAEFFTHMPIELRVMDMDAASRRAFLRMGFDGHMALDALCQAMIGWAANEDKGLPRAQLG